MSEFERYKEQVKKYKRHNISCGIRVNPEYSEVATDLYNPCAPGTRLGVTHDKLQNGLPEGVDGLHFHALCESDSYQLEKVLANLENHFGHLLPHLKWLNMGGGHLITRQDYDVAHLIELLTTFKAKYPNLKIILEPGSAIAWQTGVLVSRVLDIVENKGVNTLMLDVSFTAHMPDCLEMPYRPKIRGASDPIEGKPQYRIGGTSCLAGDYMDEYTFDWDIKVGDTLIFEDMIHYTMVKTTMFNGVKHPDIAILRENGEYQVVRKFGYKDYKSRLS
jgi:carboxynorspermidine decarboxylase